MRLLSMSFIVLLTKLKLARLDELNMKKHYNYIHKYINKTSNYIYQNIVGLKKFDVLTSHYCKVKHSYIGP